MPAPVERDPTEALREILHRDPRYSGRAYEFMFEALEHTIRRIGYRRHVTGQELLEGIRDLAQRQFGGLARLVFHTWGIRTTDDFGNIVFNLVHAGLMGKTEQDSVEDFHDLFDFDEAFPSDADPD